MTGETFLSTTANDTTDGDLHWSEEGQSGTPLPNASDVSAASQDVA